MKAKKNKRERSAQMQRVSAGLRDELGMTQWRKEHPHATCGKPLWARGEQTRWVQTNGGEAVKLTRMYGTCPQRGVGFFPLDEELGLSSGGLTPRGEETLASWMPDAGRGNCSPNWSGSR